MCSRSIIAIQFKNSGFLPPGLAAFFVLVLAIYPGGMAFGHHESIEVAYLDPCGPSVSEPCPFWDEVRTYMLKAADDLGINLDVLGGNLTRYRSVENARAVGRSVNPPDYLLYPFFEGASGLTTLQIAEQAKIKSFVFSSNVPREIVPEVGRPREKFKHWIGHLYADNTAMGRDLMMYLRDERGRPGTGRRQDALNIIALGGKFQNGDSDERIRGLREIVGRSDQLELKQLLKTNWSREDGFAKAQGLLARHKSVDIIWGANDQVVLGALEAVKQKGLIPGRDVVLGGVNWSGDILEAVRKGEISVVGGGHAISGAIALVQLYDYHHGIDFGQVEGNTQTLTMGLITPGSIDLQLQRLKQFYRNDFRQYSKIHNPKLTRYDLNIFLTRNSIAGIRPPVK